MFRAEQGSSAAAAAVANPVFTLGHSTLCLEDFLAILHAHAIDCLVDVRAHPGSRRYPHFNKDALSQSLAAAGLRYEHLVHLGGRRGRAEALADSPNGYWRNDSFRRYADYALSETFRAGFDELLALAAEQRCVLVCAESLWWRCHRRIITDWLLAAGVPVCHLLSGEASPARMTPGAVCDKRGRVWYPAEQA